MTVEMITRTIQLILAPVVMITACSITLTGLLSHYAAINDRIRLLARERIDLLRGTGRSLAEALAASDEFTRERLSEIDLQLPGLLHRHKLMRNAVLTVYCAVLIFVANMFVIALAVISDMVWLSTAALICFLLGIAALFAGILMTVFEVRISHRAIEYEAQHVLELGK